ncbi:hypothetical protein CFBP5507_06090 [Agrobacterium salinitolerans]|uniref:Uncharacterized protein n=1 Tax=Agrobacterium salinitolerans TaxID=1183413 RepID=A0A4Z1R4Z4_9HYPH|nr:hypothetical protein [Agrobacterium salinitolerans]UYZ08569.1 hypothetical protein CFBP5507_06090 [Agrobacterium salinitolerans]
MSDFEEYQQRLLAQVAEVMGLPYHAIARSYTSAAFERLTLEVMSITGRSHPVAARGIYRLLRLSTGKNASLMDLFEEWRRRVVTGKWGQEARLNRLGIYYPVRL